MKKKTKTLILSIVITLVLLLTFTITYAIFTYQETSNNTSQLIMGDIYMHYKENNQLILNNAMPQEGFKTLITGYKVNPIMAEQDAEDTSTELYACINLFQNDWGWRLDEGEDFESFCESTGTNAGRTLQMSLYGGFSVDDYNTMLSLNIIQEETIEYTNIKMNPEIATQTAEYENELTACVNLVSPMKEWLDQGSTLETYCQGTGTMAGGYTFQVDIDDGIYNDSQFQEMLSLNIIQENGDSYIINPDMANQTVGELNELMACVSLVTRERYEFDEGTTAESFCKGEGTYNDGITLKKAFEYYSDDIYYMRNFGNLLLDNNIILTSVDLPYFEFTISGKNTYSEKDIYYEILLNHGDSHKTRNTRIEDEFLRFRLAEVNPDKTETGIFANRSYSSLENKKIHVETISKNTMDEINKTYRLYMWIDEDVVIGNIGEDYTIEEWNDVFASIKVNIRGDFVEKIVYADDSCFTTIIENNEVTITDYDMTCGTEVVIPKTINDYNVTTIGKNAFLNINLKSVILPNTIKSIERYAFDNNNIRNIIMPDSVSYLDCNAFDSEAVISKNESLSCTQTVTDASCFTTTIKFGEATITDYDKTCGIDVVIPKTINGYSVTAIGKYAFNRKQLANVEIPNSVTIIQEGAFSVNQLTSIEIPDSVTTIEYGGFSSNYLQHVVLGKNVENIGEGAFSLMILYSGIENDIKTIINKSGNAFDWNSIFEQTSTDGNSVFGVGTYKYYERWDDTNREVLITLE